MGDRIAFLMPKGTALSQDTGLDPLAVAAIYRFSVAAITARLLNRLLCNHVIDGMDMVDGDPAVAARVADLILGEFNARA